MFTTKTHFEQVPLEIVKRIVEEQIKREVTKEKQRLQTEDDEDGRLKGTRFGTARHGTARHGTARHGTAAAAAAGADLKGEIMQGERKARWQELCEQASVEQDPDKLLELVRQINGLLCEKHKRLEERQPLTISSSSVLSPSEPAKTCRVLLADDSQMLRNAIKALLVEHNPTWEICEAENGRQALEKVISLQPTLVVLDLRLPDIPGHEVALQIRQISPKTKVIICSLSDSAQLAAIAQHVRADGYFEKDSSLDDLHKVIASVLRQKNEQPNVTVRAVARGNKG